MEYSPEESSMTDYERFEEENKRQESQEPASGATPPDGQEEQNPSPDAGGWRQAPSQEESGQQEGPSPAGGWQQTPPPAGGWQGSGPSYGGSWQQDPPRQDGWQEQPPAGGWGQTPPYSWNGENGYRQEQPGWQNPYQSSPAQPPKSPRKRKSAGVVVLIILCVLLAGGILFCAGYGLYAFLGYDAASSSSATSQESPAVINEDGPSIDIVDHPVEESTVGADGKLTSQEVVKKAQPSVVGIVAYLDQNGMTGMSSGSGVIISSDGYIVTNAHVLEGSTSLAVTLNDGTQYEGHLVGSDTRTDLAVLKIEAENLIAATFGNVDQLEVGEEVLAIGNPGGQQFAGTVTKGVISGLDRRVMVEGSDYSFNAIQTDAAINPGSSGGALVNLYGQVVGITSSKYMWSNNEVYEGIGFAIPSDTVKTIADDLIRYGYVTGRVRLGIYATAIDSYTAAYTGLRPGIQIVSTDVESDIATKGVIPGDIITHINGNVVTTMDEVAQELEGKSPGDEVTLTIFRPASSTNRRETTFEITVALMADNNETGTVTEIPASPQS